MSKFSDQVGAYARSFRDYCAVTGLLGELFKNTKQTVSRFAIHDSMECMTNLARVNNPKDYLDYDLAKIGRFDEMVVMNMLEVLATVAIYAFACRHELATRATSVCLCLPLVSLAASMWAHYLLHVTWAACGSDSYDQFKYRIGFIGTGHFAVLALFLVSSIVLYAQMRPKSVRADLQIIKQNQLVLIDQNKQIMAMMLQKLGTSDLVPHRQQLENLEELRELRELREQEEEEEEEKEQEEQEEQE